VIVVRIKGGLGNQLFQYAGAKGLAASLGHALKIDRTTGFLGPRHDPYQRSYRLDRFAIPQRTAGKFEITFARTLSWRHWLRFRKAETAAMHDRGEFFCEPLTRELVGRAEYLEAILASPRYFAHVEAEIRKEISPKVDWDAVMNDYLERIKGLAAVSVHVRRVDYSRPLPLDYYREAVDVIKTRVAHPHFFLFGDDFGWMSEELRWLEPKTVVLNTAPDDDIKDLALMAACPHHIIANSTFSWWGAWLSASQPGSAVAPGLG